MKKLDPYNLKSSKGQKSFIVIYFFFKELEKKVVF